MMAAKSLPSQQPTLDHLLAGLVDSAQQYRDVHCAHLSLDSRQVADGDLFLAVRGTQQDGIVFADAALERGARAVIHESAANEALQTTAKRRGAYLIHDPLLQEHLGVLAGRYYGNPSQAMQVAAVTGTDGKTSVSHFIAQAVSGIAGVCGVIGTVGNGIYGKLKAGSHTTPDAVSLQALLAEMRAQQVAYVSMEASSHGLQQGRMNGVQIAVAALTNFGRDHLDYHHDLDGYRQAKARLFAMPQLQSAVLNVEDAFGRALWDKHHKHYPITVYTTARDVFDFKRAEDWLVGEIHAFSEQGFVLNVATPAETFDLQIPLLGAFNAKNILAVIGVLSRLGFSMDVIKRAVSAVRPVTGRMQVLRKPGQPAVVVDYAHTPQALESVLTGIRRHFQGRIVCVFGCGGNRDIGKRPLMGRIAESYADSVIVTDDNPRHELPQKIAADILSGCVDKNSIHVIHDRADAIAAAINMAQTGDVVLIAGKGHETDQQIGAEKRPFSDQAAVQALFDKDSAGSGAC
jgi:UDP-N-acetylmuramoyl-L-alanyl-D-glutamate--2,6-diaminopimelate ligase